jgi:hypothetical protein
MLTRLNIVAVAGKRQIFLDDRCAKAWTGTNLILPRLPLTRKCTAVEP